jgi:predicted outer membrane repeat protein
MMWMIGLGPYLQATDYYVDGISGQDRPGRGTATQPWKTINYTLDHINGASNNVHRVLVAQGTYQENVSCDPYESIYGGYEPATWQANPEVYPTILDGNNEDTTVVLSEGSKVVGFTIRNGKRDQGGGVYCLGVNVTISNCLLENNTSTTGGSAIYAQNSNIKVTDCVLRNNLRDAIKVENGTMECSGTTITETEAFNGMITENGEGLYALNSQVTLSNCRFLRNGSGGARFVNGTATCADCLFGDNLGSGAEIQDTIIRFDRCVFSHNKGIEYGFASAGGGLVVAGFSTPKITVNESVFCQNSASAGGVAMAGIGTLTISNSVMVANHDTAGHGLCTGWISYGGPAILINNLIVNNGSMYLYLIEATLINNTLVRNQGGYELDGGFSSIKLRMINNLLWKNGDDFAISKPIILPHDLTIRNCDIEDGDYNSVNGNISVNPDFVGAIASGSIVSLNYDSNLCQTVATVTPGNLVSDALKHRILWLGTNAFYIKGNTREQITVLGNMQEFAVGGAEITVEDYRLMEGSLCIDVGTNDGAPPRDLDGNPRPTNGGLGLISDIGAYEYAPRLANLKLIFSFLPDPLVCCEGPTGRTVEVQYADQIGFDTEWLSLGTFTLTNGSGNFRDAASPPPTMRYYRAVLRGRMSE